MKTMFEAVQHEFMHLSVILGKIDFDKDLTDIVMLAQVNDALTDTYVLLNQGFCENAKMCKKCIDNRDQLRKLSELIDICEENQEVSEETFIELKNFALTIPEILIKMESVYIEKLQDVQA